MSLKTLSYTNFSTDTVQGSQGSGTSHVVLGDPYWNQVSLLLLGDGTANGQDNNSVVDASANHTALVRTGTPSQTVYTPFSNTTAGSVYFNGIGDSIRVNGDLSLKSTDMTVEAWVYLNAYNSVASTIASTYNSVSSITADCLSFFVTSSGKVQLYSAASSGNASVVGSITVPLRTWTHIAATYTNSTKSVRIFVNGVIDTTLALGTVISAGSPFVQVGGNPTDAFMNTYFLNGFLGDLRVVKSIVYSSAFTPPTDTLTSITNTVLLIAGTHGGISDSSTSNSLIVTTGSAQVSLAMKKYGSGSMYFNGASYCAVPLSSNPGLNIGTGEFTIELWLYLNSVAPTYQGIVDYRPSNTAGYMSLALSGAVLVFIVGATTAITGPSLAVGAWNHIAVVRSNGSTKLYVNGVQSGSTYSDSNTYLASTNVLIGNTWDNYYLNGYIDDLRITRAARYVANFTVPQQESYTTYQAPYYDQYTYNGQISTAGDPYWASVALLLRGSGVGSTSNNLFLDSSTNNAVITRTGTPSQGSFSPFPPLATSQYSVAANGGSMYFNGTTDYLALAHNSVYNLSTGNFTIEFWFNPNNITSTGTLFAKFATGTNFGAFCVNLVNAGIQILLSSTGSSWNIANYTIPTAAVAGGWSHFALVRNGTAFTAYVNGVSSAVATSASAMADNSGSISVGVATAASTIQYFSGYMSNLRVVNGSAVYTTTFTPPTLPLAVITNTQLLLSGTNFGIGDSSANSDVVTVGSASVNTTQVKYGSGAIAFNGTTDHIIAPNVPAFGSGDFTVEMWLYVSAGTATNELLYDTRPASTQGAYGTLYFNSDNTIHWYYSSADRIISAAIPLSTWTHVAVCRANGSTRMFINGAQTAGGTLADSTVYLASPTLLGASYGSGATIIRWLTGYMDDVRITVGAARYLGNFTPPTQQLPNYYQASTFDPYFSQVSLLLHGDGVNNANNAVFLDSSKNNLTITKAGNPAQGSFSPFPPAANGNGFSYAANGGSIYFNGTTDYLAVASNALFDLSSGDWTIEGWFYPLTTANFSTLAMCNISNVSGHGLMMDAAAHWCYYKSGGVLITGSTVTTGVWTHLALARASGVTSLYVNGVSVGTTATAPASGSVPFTIGAKSNPSEYYAGYASNVRVIKGYAVYSGTFNVPTSPLSDPTDPFASSVIAQLACEGANASTTIVDAVPGNSHTASGGAALTSAIAKYGASAVALNAGAVALGGSFTPNLKAFTVSPLTMEAWIFPTSYSAEATIFSNYAGATALGMWKFVAKAATGHLNFVWSTGALATTNNTVIDSSNNSLALTRNGTPTQGTFSPYAGRWGANFNGPTDYITGANTSFGIGNFTVEGWYYPTSFAAESTLYDMLPIGGAGGRTNAFLLVANITTGFIRIFNNGSYSSASSVGLNLNQWNHVAISGFQTSLRIYLNGTLAVTVSCAAPLTSASFTIGRYGDSSAGGFIGYISNVRSVVGTALYTSNFTPTTAPLTAISGTSLLVLQSNRYVDTSTNNTAITVGGSPAVQPAGPFGNPTAYSPSVNGGSLYFNGTTDYLTTPYVTSLGLSGDFTWECWFYLNSAPADYQMLMSGNETATTYLTVRATTIEIQFGGTAGTIASFPHGIAAKQWVHLAVVRSSGVVSGYINGVSKTVTQPTQAGTLFSQTVSTTVYIGRWNAATNYFPGYISDLRVVKGIAVYVVGFTPPAAPLTAVAGTSLLLNGINAGVFDGTGVTDIGTISSASVQYATVKYSTGAMNFNGTTDYLALPTSSALGAGDFTVEFWHYRTVDQNQYVFVLGTAPNWGDATGVQIINYIGNFAVQVGAASSTAVLANPTINTWHHVAVVRQGSTVKFYLNGVASGVVLTDSTNLTATNLRIGSGVAGSWSTFKGVMDDLRITRGVARYTANFTPPTASLPKSSTGDSYFQYNTLLVQGTLTQPLASVNSTMAPTLNAWNHVAAVIDSTTPASTTIRLSVNGAMQSFTGNNLSTQNVQYSAPKLGNTADGLTPLSGYMDEVRFTSAVRYVDNFTPLEAAMNPMLGTASLLLAGTNGAIYDSAADNNLTVNGNTDLMVTVNRFGGSSIYFDGVGDWLSTPSKPALVFGSSDFTVECWVNFPGTGNPLGVWAKKAVSGFGIELITYLLVPTMLVSMDGTTWGIQSASSVAFTANTWGHVAITRNGNVFTLWVNGQSGAVATLAGTIIDANLPFVIGNGQDDTTYAYKGYIDDFRYTKGVARYTSPFTPPTTAFLNV